MIQFGSNLIGLWVTNYQTEPKMWADQMATKWGVCLGFCLKKVYKEGKFTRQLQSK